MELIKRYLPNIYWIMKELMLTLSNKKSFFSSKRIERFILFAVAIVLTVLYVWHRRADLSAEGFLVIVGPLFVYAGFNTIHIKKDKNEVHNNTTYSDNSN